jgi:hypothetical protein
MTDHDQESDHKGEKLPGVAGALQAVIGSKPIEALLTPAFTVYGEHLRERAVEMVTAWNEKRRSNIREHRRRVEHVAGYSFPEYPTVAQAQLAFEWAENAQNIDPNIEPELAALWESLLLKISQNSPEARRLMLALERLEPEDTVILLDRSRLTFLNEAETESLKRLKAAGLVEGRWRIRNYRGFLINLFLLCLVMVVSILTLRYYQMHRGGVITRSAFWDLYSEISFLEISLSLTAVATFLFLGFDARYGWYRFTELGEDLARQGRRFRDALT